MATPIVLCVLATRMSTHARTPRSHAVAYRFCYYVAIRKSYAFNRALAFDRPRACTATDCPAYSTYRAAAHV